MVGISCCLLTVNLRSGSLVGRSLLEEIRVSDKSHRMFLQEHIYDNCYANIGPILSDIDRLAILAIDVPRLTSDECLDSKTDHQQEEQDPQRLTPVAQSSPHTPAEGKTRTNVVLKHRQI